MGADIHLYVEKKVDGKWVTADKWTKEDEEDGYVHDDSFYKGRNYDLFAILADVRNGRGFAGCDTGDGFNPIDMPRGLPADVCPEVKDESDRWDGDGHSHSYFTVAELLAYDWTQVTNKRGVINSVGFFEWSRYRRDRGLGPDSYCGGISGRDIKMISAEEMEAKIAELHLDNYSQKQTQTVMEKLGNYNCRVQWTSPYYRECAHFWSDTIPRLLKLGKPEDVRIVFWFDN